MSPVRLHAIISLMVNHIWVHLLIFCLLIRFPVDIPFDAINLYSIRYQFCIQTNKQILYIHRMNLYTNQNINLLYFNLYII